MCAKKKHTSSNDFLQYLKDDLSKQERHELERSLEADPFEKEAMEGLESIPGEKAEKDLLSLHDSLRKRLNRRKRRTWYSIAATAASILIVGTIFLNIYDLNPDDAGTEALTEKTFRSLESESTVEEIPETVTQEKAPEKGEPIEKAPETPKVTETSQSEIKGDKHLEEQDLVILEFVTEDEIELEAMDVAEAAPILAVEAAPIEKSKRAGRSKRAVMAEESIEKQLIGQVNGIVLSSEDLNPLPGASIVIRGTNSGTVADMQGRFTLPAEDSQTTVVASFIGMETEEYQLVSEGENRLVLQPDAQTLDEIVIVAQGSEKLLGVTTGTVRNVQPDDKTPSYTPAEPRKGYRALKKHMEQNMEFPADYTPGEREVVVLRFTVLANGSISDIETLRTPGEAYTLEASRLIMEGPEWTPAKITSGPINEQVRVRIVFKK